MNWKEYAQAQRMLGYIEGVNDADAGSDVAHDLIQETVNALADLMSEILTKDEKKTPK